MDPDDYDTYLTDLVDEQLRQQGISAIRVSDGHVFTFTLETLERLLEAAEEDGKVVIFVKRGAEA